MTSLFSVSFFPLRILHHQEANVTIQINQFTMDNVILTPTPSKISQTKKSNLSSELQ